MKIITKESFEESLSYIISTLKKGGVIVFPTETAYGLAADPCSRQGIEKIFKIKQRSKKKVLPLIAADHKQVKRFCRISEDEQFLINRCWPGPYSIILNRKDPNDGLCLQTNTYAIRVSSHKLAQKLASKLGYPITSTSANVSGKKTCYSMDEVQKQFEKAKVSLDIIIDYGILEPNPVSKILKIKGNRLIIFR